MLQPQAIPSQQPVDAIRSMGPVDAFEASPSRPRLNVLATLAKASSAAPSASTPRDSTAAATAAAIPSRPEARGRQASGEVSGEGSDDGDDEPESFGNLKTNLVWDCSGRRLCLSARQYVETPRKLEVKARGMLDTASGQHRVWGHLRRNFYTHVPLLQRLLTAQTQRSAGGWVDEPNLDPDAFLPGGMRSLLFQDWCIAPGLSYDTARSPPLPPSASAASTAIGGGGASGGGATPGTAAAAAAAWAGSRSGLATLLGQRTRYQLVVKKNPQVLKNTERGEVWVAARALAEFDPKASEVTLGGSLRLKAVQYGVTGGQDLKLALGLDVVHDEGGRLRKMPYVHLSDGKLSARLQNRRWQLTYTLA